MSASHACSIPVPSSPNITEAILPEAETLDFTPTPTTIDESEKDDRQSEKPAANTDRAAITAMMAMVNQQQTCIDEFNTFKELYHKRYTEKMANLQDKCDQITHDSCLQATAIEALQRRDADQHDSEDMLGILQTSVNRMETHIVAIEDKVARCNRDCERLKRRETEAEARRRAHARQHETLAERIESLSECMFEYEDEGVQMRSELAAAKRSITALEEALNVQKRESEDQKKEIEALKDEVSTNTRVARLERQIKAIAGDLYLRGVDADVPAAISYE